MTIAFSDAGLNGFIPYGNVANGIPGAPNPDLSTGNVPLPRGVDMTSPDPDDIARGATQSWNAFVERRLPLDVAVSVGYVGTRTDGQYASRGLNYAESGGNANRQLFAKAGTAAINVLAASARSKYHSLQVAVNRPFKNGILLKGAYTLSRARNEVDDDGGGYTWAMPSQFSRNYALAGYDRPHMLQMGFVYELPFARNSDNPVALVIKDWQINGIASWLSGTPFTIGGDNGLLQQSGGVADDQRRLEIPSPASARPGLTRSGTTRPRSPSPATRGGTPDATSSADRGTGTSTSRCSGRFRSATTASRSAPSRRTCSTTRSGATR